MDKWTCPGAALTRALFRATIVAPRAHTHVTPDHRTAHKETIMKARRSFVASCAIAMTLAAALLATSVRAAPEPEKSLYDRLGGVFAIAAVVDHFSDAVVDNPIVGRNSKNPALRKWHTESLDRLPGLKFMRTLWVCQVSGGPFKFSATKPGKTELGLEEAHRQRRSHRKNSTRSRRSWGAAWTTSRCRRVRRTKSSRPSQRTRARSRLATRRRTDRPR